MTLREWADHARLRGVAAVFEAAQVRGHGSAGAQPARRRAAHDRPRAHHATAAGDRAPGAVGPAGDCGTGCAGSATNAAAQPSADRRLDSDAAAVQIMTVFVAKGLQFPIVYLPFAFNRYVRTKDDILLYHEEDGTRCLYIGGKKGPDRRKVEELNRQEAARDDIRLTYVALDAGAVAGGGVVGADPRRAQRRAVAAAARAPGRRCRSPDPLRAQHFRRRRVGWCSSAGNPRAARSLRNR